MKNKKIKKVTIKPQAILCPTRMDIAGGFLDLWPMSALISDCFVINCSIPIWTSIKWNIGSHFSRNKTRVKQINSIHSTKKIQVNIQSPGVSRSHYFKNINSLLTNQSPHLSLLKMHWKHWSQESHLRNLVNKHVSIDLQSKSPVGAGLGASSSLCVGLSKMFSKWAKQSISDVDRLLLCRDIESSVLKTPAGTQDYIPALYPESGFLYIISYARAGNIQWERKKLPKEFFKDHILLIDTQCPHHSGQNNWKTYKQVIDGNKILLRGLHQLRDNALQAVRICEREDWSALNAILKKEYLLRKTIFTGWLNRKVGSVCNWLMEGGAAVKLCGAGGGGAAIVFTKNKKQKKRIQELCLKHKIPILMS